MPTNKALYPPNWFSLRAELRARSEGVCECRGECGIHHGRRCTERNGKPATHFKGTVALAAAHLCNDGPNCAKLSHLKDLCQRCHLRFDKPLHWRHRREKANRGKLGDISNPLSPPDPPNPTEG